MRLAQTNNSRWYWLVYPLININGLWETDIDFLRSQWAVDADNATSDSKFKQLYSYQIKEKKSVYELLPDFTVIDGRIGKPATGQGAYNFDNYIRLVEFQIKNDKTSEFERFVRENVVPAASKFLPKKNNEKPDKLPRFLRSVKLEVHQSRVPDFLKLAQQYLVPAAQKTQTNIFFYRAVFAGGDNFFLFLPFEELRESAGSKTPVLSSLLQKAFSPAEARRISAELKSMMIGGEEWVGQIRPDMSSNLENKYSKWW